MSRAIGWLVCCGLSSVVSAQNIPLQLLHLPPHYQISVYASGLASARQLAVGSKGTIFVGTRDDKVYALQNVPNKPPRVYIIAKGLNRPNGVAFYHGSLYVAETQRIIRYNDIENHLDHPPVPIVIRDHFSTAQRHGLRYISFGPDNKLYLSLGAPCNVCEPESPNGTITRMNPDGSQFEIYAQGVRDSVGFDWHPETWHLWFSDNGRDEMGDDIPPDKFNVAPKNGLHFGFPYYHAKGLPDPVYGKRFPESKFTPPTYALPAHVAALGVKFGQGNNPPSRDTKGNRAAYVAEHGSWNRSSKVGYQVVRLWVNQDKVVNSEIFVNGWLQGQQAWGRPVDVLALADGTLLISDDVANVVYRVVYR